jgi:hypothetical protein
MKRILYILAFALFSSVSIIACTEEEVLPAKSSQSSGGGSGSFDPGAN